MRTVGFPGVVGTSSDVAVLVAFSEGCMLLFGFRYSMMSVMTNNKSEP